MLSLRGLIQDCPVNYYLAVLGAALQLVSTSDSRFLTTVFFPSTGEDCLLLRFERREGTNMDV